MIEWWWLIVVAWLSSTLGAYTIIVMRDGFRGWREELPLLVSLLVWPVMVLVAH